MQVLCVAALAALAAGCETFRTKPPEEAVDEYAQGRRLMGDGDCKGAETLLVRAAANPDRKRYRTDALLLLGDCRMELKDYPGAQQAYQQAQVDARTRAINARAKAGLGNAMMAQQRFAEAATAYEKALAVSDTDINAPQTMLQLAKAYIRSGQWELGRDRLTKLTSRYPESLDAPEARDILTMPADVFAVQAGSFVSRADAETMVATLREHDVVGARIAERSYGGEPFAVRLGHFVRYDEALKEAGRLKPIAPEACVVP